MHSLNSTFAKSSTNSSSAGSAADRDMVAVKLSGMTEADLEVLRLLLDDPRQDETLFSGIELYLNRAAEGRFLHTMKLEKTGEWLGNQAPSRLQIRLMEIAKSSHHPAFQAFRTGVVRSGGLERAYPKG